jgi:hypothetical protein
MKMSLIILVVALAALVGAFLISSASRTANDLSPKDMVFAQEMGELRMFYSDSPIQPAMPDHLIKVLSDGTAIFFHFDRPVGQDSKILWVGTFVPGRFCKADQERVQATYGPGFVHFHQKSIPGNDPNAGHGGKGGEQGYWFRHIAVTDIPKGDMMAGTGAPWGPVRPGIDMNFMPTPAPSC